MQIRRPSRDPCKYEISTLRITILFRKYYTVNRRGAAGVRATLFLLYKRIGISRTRVHNIILYTNT